AVVCKNDEDASRLHEFRTKTGIVAAPDACWLLLRSLATLRLRVERQTETGREIARRLAEHPGVSEVRYPGFGGLMSFDVGDGAVDEATLRELLAALRAASAGDFDFRLTEGQGGLGGELAKAYNDLAERRSHLADELQRVARVVRDGRLNERVSLPRYRGAW